MQPFAPRFANLLLWRGISAIIFGLLALLWPGITLSILLIIFGAFLFADGILHVAASFGHVKHDNDWWYQLIRGILSIFLGAVTLWAPFVTGLVLVWYVGGWLLFIGILEIIVSIRLGKKLKGEGWYIIGGILSILMGILFFVFPIASAWTFIWIVGVYSVVAGIWLLGAYIRIRRRHAHDLLKSGSPA
jgi:uncharacterized membrane protein HdeD (DUF308 family)